jgi:NAD(P)-dependent dehydrogenase (short-subunit alcohol dehydrogenase family)
MSASKAVVVTGAGSGIGAAIASQLASDGAKVIVSDINAEAAERVAHSIHAVAQTCDVANETSFAALIDRCVSEFGALDVLVNNAGIGEASTPIEQKTAEDWNRVITTNLSSVFFGIKHAARVMKAQGRGGVIVNVSSILGVVGFNGAPAYTAAKHGMLGLTKAAALELAPSGIRVVAVSPGFINTPMIKGFEEAVLPLHPIGRLGEPADVANVVAFLASDKASFVTGCTYLVDGGYTSQ